MNFIEELFKNGLLYQFMMMAVFINIFVDILWKPFMKEEIKSQTKYRNVTRIFVFFFSFFLVFLTGKMDLVMIKYGLFYDAVIVTVLSILFYDIKIYPKIKEFVLKVFKK